MIGSVEVNEANFPDDVFREYVLTNFDTDGDGYLSKAELEAVTKIDVCGSSDADGGITSLGGIEKFVNLQVLDCSYNSGITSLDVSNITALKKLKCGHTQISALDVSKNTSLTSLYCTSTNIAYVDTSNCAQTLISAYNCKYPITVTDGFFDTNSISGFDPSRVLGVAGADWDETTGILSKIELVDGTAKITYAYDCDGKGGHNVAFTLVPDEISTYYKGVEINAENFPDEKFREYVSANFDLDGNDLLSKEERCAVEKINVGTAYLTYSLKGIENFPLLKELKCMYIVGLEEVDLSANSQLTNITFEYSGLKNLDLSNNTMLISLDCSNCAISNLDLSNNIFLTSLKCYTNKLTSLDLSKNTQLTHLNCADNNITYLDLRQNVNLLNINCELNKLTSLEVNKNTQLKDLSCHGNPIKNLDISNNIVLNSLWCDYTNVAYLDISNCTSISRFDVDHNKHPITVTDGTFDTKTIAGFDPARVSNVEGAEWDETTGILSKIVEGTAQITYTYDCDGKGGHNETFILEPDESSTYYTEDETGIAINAENFPDETFREEISINFDSDENGYLSETECNAAEDIYLPNCNIGSLKGIEYFTKLKNLYCDNNNDLAELNLSSNTALEILQCEFTQIGNLDVSNNLALKELYCNDTKISELNVSSNTELIILSCSNTKISNLDVTSNTKLTTLYCGSTEVSELDISNNTELEDLICGNTPITKLDVSNNTVLSQLDCSYTNIAYIDVSECTNLSSLSASSCHYSITLTNGTFDTHSIAGFDQSKVDVNSVFNADYDPDSGKFINIPDTDIISYTYDCGNGYTVVFELYITP